MLSANKTMRAERVKILAIGASFKLLIYAAQIALTALFLHRTILQDICTLRE